MLGHSAPGSVAIFTASKTLILCAIVGLACPDGASDSPPLSAASSKKGMSPPSKVFGAERLRELPVDKVPSIKSGESPCPGDGLLRSVEVSASQALEAR